MNICQVICYIGTNQTSISLNPETLFGQPRGDAGSLNNMKSRAETLLTLDWKESWCCKLVGKEATQLGISVWLLVSPCTSHGGNKEIKDMIGSIHFPT